mgnify:CR=1 FL=1
MMEFKIPTMSCGHCVGVITQALHALDQHASIEIDLESKLVKIESKTDRASVLAALSAAGYPAG